MDHSVCILRIHSQSKIRMWHDVFGDHLQTKKHGIIDTTYALDGKSIVGLYFSANWCSPCREFTPVLCTMYERVLAEHSNFEIVYISSDQTDEDFDTTYENIPFAALPFSKRDLKASLVAKFSVPWVPFLIFLDSKGNIIERDGRRLFVSAKCVETVWDILSPDSDNNQ